MCGVFFIPDQQTFTWHRKCYPVFSRLDYFLIPSGTLDLVEECTILPGFLSDHSFVKLVIVWDEAIRGPGTWKLNTNILKNEEYIRGINNIIENRQVYGDLNPEQMWETLKLDFADFSQKILQESCLPESSR